MAQNMWDNSQTILQSQSGANIGAGIRQAGAAFSQGIQRYYEKKEQDQKQEMTVQWLEQSGAANNLFPQLAAVKDPAERKKVIMAGIKGAGLENMAQIAQMDAQRKRQQQQDAAAAEMQAAQMAELKARERDRMAQAAEADREARARKVSTDPIQEDPAALIRRGSQTGMRPPTGDEAARRYIREGGRDVKFMGAVGKLGANNSTFATAKEAADSIPGGAKGQVTQTASGRYVVQYQTGPGDEKGVKQVKIGPKSYLYHGDSKRYFDEQGQPVIFPSGRDVAEAAEMDAAIRKFGGAKADSSKSPAAPDESKLSDSDQQALAWARANASDPRAAKILQKLGLAQ